MIFAKLGTKLVKYFDISKFFSTFAPLIMFGVLRTYGFWLLALGFWLLAFSSCNTTKYVPEGEYLLNKARIKCVDDKQVATNELRPYLRQKQNTEILGFWKLQLHIYNTAPADTTSKANKRLARNAHKMGEAPIIYDEDATAVSMKQLKQQMNNLGYFNAEVDTVKVEKIRKNDVNDANDANGGKKKKVKGSGKKMNLTYVIHAHQPYTIRNYDVAISEPFVAAIASDDRCIIKPGQQFSTSDLDDERERIATSLRNRGYFYAEKAMLEFSADSALGSHEVDVTIHAAPYVEHLEPEALQRLKTRYSIRRVCYQIDFDPMYVPDTVVLQRDSDKYGNEYVWVGRRFLRKDALRWASLIRPGQRYAEWRVERTYARMNAMAPVKYVDIAFTAVGDTLLDCFITVSRGRLNSVSAEIEGTYSAGDWGIGAGLTYTNKNIFHGAEQLTIGGRASYEWRANGGAAIEAKAEAGLTFPTQFRINIAYNYQQRPDEFTRTIANAGLGYTIPRRPGQHWTHQFNLLDINYIYVPWMSDEFKQFLDKSSVLKASYEDLFIVDWSYTGTYSSYNARFPNRSYVHLAFYVETAGNALYALSKAAHLQQNDQGAYMLWKIPFAQYAKGDFNFAFHHILTPKHRLVYHLGVGVVCPYLNLSAVPFQKRYFGGGANGIRGWQARTLGPGTFRGDGSALMYDLQTGDIHLDMNMEYRFKVLSFLELAAFLDAGNIWTIRDYYDKQPGGVFLWDQFYKQIAWSYGVGIRLDLSILIFRVDFGVKLHDPSRIAEGTQWRTAGNGLKWKDDMTLHFAIGYPF